MTCVSPSHAQGTQCPQGTCGRCLQAGVLPPLSGRDPCTAGRGVGGGGSAPARVERWEALVTLPRRRVPSPPTYPSHLLTALWTGRCFSRASRCRRPLRASRATGGLSRHRRRLNLGVTRATVQAEGAFCISRNSVVTSSRETTQGRHPWKGPLPTLKGSFETPSGHSGVKGSGAPSPGAGDVRQVRVPPGRARARPGCVPGNASGGRPVSLCSAGFCQLTLEAIPQLSVLLLFRAVRDRV